MYACYSICRLIYTGIILLSILPVSYILQLVLGSWVSCKTPLTFVSVLILISRITHNSNRNTTSLYTHQQLRLNLRSIHLSIHPSIHSSTFVAVAPHHVLSLVYQGTTQTPHLPPTGTTRLERLLSAPVRDLGIGYFTVPS
jgi:hypothetical protein